MSSICEQLSTSDPQRIIVFDSSPLLHTTEAPVLASHAGQIVLVVQADTTPQQSVLGAIGKLDQVKAVNLILNQASGGTATTYGAPYGGYGYGHEDAH
jgi:hypothetical protein